MIKQKTRAPVDITLPDSERSQADVRRVLEYLRTKNAHLTKLDALIESKKAAAKKKRS